MSILPMGREAVLVEVADLDAVLALHDALSPAPAGVCETVPAARTVLVRFDPARIPVAAVRAWVNDAASRAAEAMHATAVQPAHVELAVHYDGTDLDETAALVGESATALAARHERAVWRVAFTGFAPGFGYLVSDDWRIDVPRLAAPRPRVPAGAVGLAAGYCGVYPRQTPGGWRLIGRTDATLFDPEAQTPALLAPGAAVRFRAVRELIERPAPSAARSSVRTLERVQGGFARVDRVGSATVQDLGRTGLTHLGVSRSGALDRGALRLANRLVGNPEDAAAIEIAPGGLVATALRDCWIALAGAWAPVWLDGVASDAYRALRWRQGTVLEIGYPTSGARVMLAVAGGVAARAVLGSCATDTLAGLGPEPLRAGTLLLAGEASAGPPPLDHGPWGWQPEVREIGMRWGARADWFTDPARRRFVESEWRASSQADRVGMRLDGPVLERAVEAELPSEGMVPGAVQVPPSGPVVLLADAPATGGYPVIAVVDEPGIDLLAQSPPGARIRFRPLS